nr:hypothetical protein I308_04979 [Cryptococcus tetragattii IND107]
MASFSISQSLCNTMFTRLFPRPMLSTLSTTGPSLSLAP